MGWTSLGSACQYEKKNGAGTILINKIQRKYKLFPK
nr:hypothetical protein [Tanacetum cinerariifolium]